MLLQERAERISYSLLTVIVNRGKGSKVMQFVNKLGVTGASCLLGKGTIKSKPLELIAMNEVNKEIIFIVVQAAKENDILEQLNQKFHFDRPNHGIAFTMSLAGILRMKEGASIHWRDSKEAIDKYRDSDYAMVLIIVDKEKAEDVIDISQSAGFHGGTIIKARGTAGELNIVLDMIVEPEKEAVLMVTDRNRVNELVTLLNGEFKFKEKNTGILVTAEINQTIGLYQNNL